MTDDESAFASLAELHQLGDDPIPPRCPRAGREAVTPELSVAQ